MHKPGKAASQQRRGKAIGLERNCKRFGRTNGFEEEDVETLRVSVQTRLDHRFGT
jgi:hypothetical protein